MIKQFIEENQTKEIQSEKEEIAHWAEGLEKMASRIRQHFPKLPTFKRAVQYLKGLLSPIERKNGWQLAESIGDETPYGVQNLLNRVNWDADAVRDDLQSYVTEHLGEEQAIFVLDETGFLKKGEKSVGVQRQYSGTAGRIENCQIGVFLSYATSKGHVLIDRELYLPQNWAQDKARREEAGVPEEIVFQTKPQLAAQMLKKAFENGVSAKWITADEVYGNNGKLRQWLESEHRRYVLAVSCDTDVWVAFDHYRVDVLVKTLPQKSWKRLSAGNGSKGPRWYDWAIIRINNVDSLEWERWVLFRRNVEDPTEIAYYLVFSPQETTLKEMVGVAGNRWTIEICFEAAKNEVGLDQYEVRKWQGWYHHITLSMLALAFLTVTSNQANEKVTKKGDVIVKRSSNSMKEFKMRRSFSFR